MGDYIVPILFVALILIAAIKKKHPYQCMIEGAKEGFSASFGLFPNIMAIFLALSLMQASGLNDLLSRILSVPMQWLGIPKELAGLVVLRPVSGSGSLAMLNDVLTKYGPDSYIGRCATMIVDGCDTVFYIATIYFARTKVKNTGKAIAIALAVSFLSCLLGCWLCRIM